MRSSLFITTLLSASSATGAFVVNTAPSRSTSITKTYASTEASNEGKEKVSKPASEPPVIEPLKPFLPAADPNYINIGSVGEEDFILTKTGSPTKDELTNENVLKIVYSECSDLEVNTLVWKCLGYRFDEEAVEWTNEEVFPKWKEKYPTPPDMVGMQRIYERDIDRPCLLANQALTRSIPVENKQNLKVHLKPLGFTGFKVGFFYTHFRFG